MVEKSDWISDDEREEESTVTAFSSNDSQSKEIEGDATKATEGEEILSNTSNTTTTSEDEDPKPNSHEIVFEEGDHVYSWCSFWGIPRAYAHHGIVIDRDVSAEEVTILDFSCLVVDENEDGKSGTSSGGNSSSFQASSACESASAKSNTRSTDGESLSYSIIGGSANHTSILRTFTINDLEARRVWRKVKYEASFLESVTRRAGTVSKRSCDPVDTVLQRVEFLNQNLHLLSSYDLLQANCEHVAVWCKTGHFSSLQLLAKMGHTLALSTVPTVAVSTATTTVPAAGLCGWFGFTTTVSVVAVMPWVIPLAILPAAVSAGRSVFDRTRWRQTTESLNASFEDWKFVSEHYVCKDKGAETIEPLQVVKV